MNPILKVYNLIVANLKKISLYGSFGLTMYKAFDYRTRFLRAEEVKEILHTALDKKRTENEGLRATYNDILLNISLDNYTINDIKMPFCYQIYDDEIGMFRMVKFNNAYQEKYGDNPAEYFAKTNEEMRGFIGKQWEANNQKVLNNGGPLEFTEPCILKDGTISNGKYIKWIALKPTGTYLFMIEINLKTN